MNLTKKIFQRAAIYLPFIVCITLLTFNPPWQEFLWWNIGAQLLIFMFFACIPAFITYRMSYVDIAWPWGLVAIGILVLLKIPCLKSLNITALVFCFDIEFFILFDIFSEIG